MTPPRAPSLSLGVARRALVVAVAAVLVAVAALVAALLSGSDSDPPESADTSQAQAQVDVEAALEAVAMAQAAAARAEDAVAAVGAAVASAEAAAIEAREAATGAQEAAGMAMEAYVMADMAATADDTGAAVTDDAAATEASDDESDESGESVASGGSSESVESAEEPAAEIEDPTPAAEDPPVPEDDEGDPSETLRGEPYEFGPQSDAALFVVGVSHDEVLNVRDTPAGTVVATLDPLNLAGGRAPFVTVRDAAGTTVAESELRTAITATGQARQLPTTVWYQFRAAGITGWSSAAYLAEMGAPDDFTAEARAGLGDDLATDTMEELGRRVAELLASEEPQSRIVVTARAGVAEGVADIGLDIIGLADDSLLGYRIAVSADPAGNWLTDDDPGPYTLSFVERTAICRRGVSPGGLCN